MLLDSFKLSYKTPLTKQMIIDSKCSNASSKGMSICCF